MSPNIVVGRSPILGPRTTGGGSSLVSARLQVVAGTQLIEGSAYIVWDATPDWDDIGLLPDYSTTGSIYVPDGEYHIDAYARLGPASEEGGTALIAIRAGGSGDPLNGVDKQMSTPQGPDIGPKLSTSGVYRFYGDSAFQIEIALFSGIDQSVEEASVEITKQRSAPPL